MTSLVSRLPRVKDKPLLSMHLDSASLARSLGRSNGSVAIPSIRDRESQSDAADQHIDERSRCLLANDQSLRSLSSRYVLERSETADGSSNETTHGQSRAEHVVVRRREARQGCLGQNRGPTAGRVFVRERLLTRE